MQYFDCGGPLVVAAESTDLFCCRHYLGHERTETSSGSGFGLTPWHWGVGVSACHPLPTVFGQLVGSLASTLGVGRLVDSAGDQALVLEAAECGIHRPWTGSPLTTAALLELGDQFVPVQGTAFGEHE